MNKNKTAHMKWQKKTIRYEKKINRREFLMQPSTSYSFFLPVRLELVCWNSEKFTETRNIRVERNRNKLTEWLKCSKKKTNKQIIHKQLLNEKISMRLICVRAPLTIARPIHWTSRYLIKHMTREEKVFSSCALTNIRIIVRKTFKQKYPFKFLWWKHKP